MDSWLASEVHDFLAGSCVKQSKKHVDHSTDSDETHHKTRSFLYMLQNCGEGPHVVLPGDRKMQCMPIPTYRGLSLLSLLSQNLDTLPKIGEKA